MAITRYPHININDVGHCKEGYQASQDLSGESSIFSRIGLEMLVQWRTSRAGMGKSTYMTGTVKMEEPADD